MAIVTANEFAAERRGHRRRNTNNTVLFEPLPLYEPPPLPKKGFMYNGPRGIGPNAASLKSTAEEIKELSLPRLQEPSLNRSRLPPKGFLYNGPNRRGPNVKNIKKLRLPPLQRTLNNKLPTKGGRRTRRYKRKH